MSSPQQHLVTDYKDRKHCILHPASKSALYVTKTHTTLDDDDPFSWWRIKNWFAFSLLFFPALSFLYFLFFLCYSFTPADSLNAFLVHGHPACLNVSTYQLVHTNVIIVPFSEVFFIDPPTWVELAGLCKLTVFPWTALCDWFRLALASWLA